MSAEEDHLEALKQSLYNRRREPPPLARSALSGAAESAKTDWRRPKPLPVLSRLPSTGRLKKILYWSMLFFLVMVGLTGLVFYRGRNLVSAGNVVVKVNGPLEAAAGEELNLLVEVENRNQADLELVDLVVEYPKGTRKAGPVSEALPRERIPLGRIAPGGKVRQLVRAVLFGEKGSREPIRFTVEYRLADSSAIFDKEVSYEVTIGSTPLILSLNLPKEVNNNQELSFNVEIQSNSGSAISEPVLLLDYPAGFRFLKAKPPPARGDNIWRFTVLSPGEKQSVQIYGTLEGQAEDQKSFRVAAGTLEADSDLELAATYGSALETVTIKRPFISLAAAVNGNGAAEHIAGSREPLRVDINWINNLPSEVIDGELTVQFSGPALDPASVSAPRGFYHSLTNTVLWNKLSEPSLGVLSPGDSGQAALTFASLSLAGSEGLALRQPELELLFKFKGKRVGEGGQTETIYSETTQKIKFNSVVQLAGKVLQRSGPFANRGPLPPKVNEETTYTVVWAVLNSSSPLSDAKVTASLPSYIKWLGVVQPAGETVGFEADGSGGGRVVWDLNQVNPGTGTAAPAREVAFQIGLTPSLSQVGEAPLLVGEPTLSGFDTFTKQTLAATLKRVLDTQLVSEPQFQLGEERVVN